MLFPDLFAMCQQPDITVSQVKSNTQSVTFSRWLLGEWRENWEIILLDLTNIHLSNGVDSVTWKFGC
jgi:hypothetical protein